MSTPAIRRSTATPLAVLYAIVIAHASLYPFVGWRDLGEPLWAFLHAPHSPYWSAFDVIANTVGYAPLGLALGISLWQSPRPKWLLWLVSAAAWALISCYALGLECLQNFLPGRVPSRLDWLLNSAGALMGMLTAIIAHHGGQLARWRNWREQHLINSGYTRALLVHLLLWPLALLFPTSLPFALGQVYERLEQALGQLLAQTPFLHLIPLRGFEFEPMLPIMQSTSIALGVAIPCYLIDTIATQTSSRLLLRLFLLATGAMVIALSYSLSYGPGHALAWWTMQTAGAMAAGLLLSALSISISPRWLTLPLLMALAAQTLLLNQSSTNAYLALNLQEWEQGRFIRFSAPLQWLSWAWPYTLGIAAIGRLLAPSKSPQESKNIQ